MTPPSRDPVKPVFRCRRSIILRLCRHGTDRCVWSEGQAAHPGREVFVTPTTCNVPDGAMHCLPASENNFEETHLKSDLNIADRRRGKLSSPIARILNPVCSSSVVPHRRDFYSSSDPFLCVWTNWTSRRLHVLDLSLMMNAHSPTLARLLGNSLPDYLRDTFLSISAPRGLGRVGVVSWPSVVRSD